MSDDDNTHTYRLEQDFLRGPDGLYEWAPGIMVTEEQLRWMMAEATERARRILHESLSHWEDALEDAIAEREHQAQVRADRAADFIEGMSGKRTRERLEATSQIYMAPKGTPVHLAMIDEGEAIGDTGPWQQVGYLAEDGISWTAEPEDPSHHGIDITQLMTSATVGFTTPMTPELMGAIVGDVIHPMAERRHIPPIRSIKWATHCTHCGGAGELNMPATIDLRRYRRVCDACGGTGKRRDQEATTHCTACHGTGGTALSEHPPYAWACNACGGTGKRRDQETTTHPRQAGKSHG